MSAFVSELWIHPIKSCRGISVQSARVVRRGFEHDRRYMLVDEEGVFITQREEHRLALVGVSLGSGELHLAAPGQAELSIPAAAEDGARVRVRVWHSECIAVVEPQGSQWFSRFLDRPCRLVYMPDDSERAVSPKRARPGDLVGFQDGYPFLMISEASLADLSARAGTSLTMSRFRPNIVIAGVAPYAEYSLAFFRIGEVSFRNAKPCARCVITTIDPQTAEAGKEPLTTLAGYRKTDDGVVFGVNLIHSGVGSVEVGGSLDPDESRILLDPRVN